MSAAADGYELDRARTKILITGAGGRLGRGLVERLMKQPLAPEQQLVLIDQKMAAFPLDAEVMIGDLGATALLERVASLAPDLVFHLAALPGGACERRPALSRRVNLDASLDFLAAAAAGRRPRFVYASSIAVFGAPDDRPVDDDTPARPASTYGAHKLMMEVALADATRRGVVAGTAVRLAGLVAAPGGAVGLKSAFLSEVFHALAEGRAYTLPVGPEGQVWLLSFAAAVEVLITLAAADLGSNPRRSAINAPAVRTRVADLVAAIAAALGADPALVDYAPDAALQAAFAAYPPLTTPAADALGLRHDGDLDRLVRRVLSTLSPQGPPC